MKNIPIGSLITTYEAGYFVLIRYEGNQCVFIKVATKTGVPVNSKREMSCDEHWCHLVTKEQIAAILNNFNALYGMIA